MPSAGWIVFWSTFVWAVLGWIVVESIQILEDERPREHVTQPPVKQRPFFDVETRTK